jgi:hypothetical protein
MRVATGTLPHATFVHPCTSAPHSCNWAPPWTESVSRSGQLNEAQVRAHANPPVPGQAHSVPIAFPGESARLQQAQNVPVTRAAPGEIRAVSTASQPLIPGNTPQLPPIVAIMPLTVDDSRRTGIRYWKSAGPVVLPLSRAICRHTVDRPYPDQSAGQRSRNQQTAFRHPQPAPAW